MNSPPKPPRGISRNQMPVSSFDPRYKELLLKGCHELVEVPCNSEKDAHRLQSLLCTFRARMKKHHGEEGRAHWEPLYGVIVTKSADLRSVVLRPRSSEFDSLVSGPIKSSSPLDGPLETNELSSDPLEEFMPLPDSMREDDQ